MTDRYEKQDHYTGIPWVSVTPQEVRGHPKGQLTPLLWLIGLFFIGSALLKIWLLAQGGLGLGGAVLSGLFPLLTGIGLLMRAPWALILAVLSAGFSLFGLVRGFGTDTSLIYLGETIIMAGILFYLMDGDRPNFIYRHRYRKYSVLKDGE